MTERIVEAESLLIQSLGLTWFEIDFFESFQLLDRTDNRTFVISHIHLCHLCTWDLTDIPDIEGSVSDFLVSSESARDFGDVEFAVHLAYLNLS